MLLLAHPVAVGEHRNRAADTAQHRQHRGCVAGRNRRHDQAAHDGAGIAQRQRRAGQDGEEHRADQHLHHPLEAGEAAGGDQRAAGEGVRDGAPGPRHEVAGERRRAEAAGAGQRGAHRHRPQHQVDEEVPAQPARQVRAPAFDGGRAGGQLPAGDALVQHALEAGGEDDDPEERQSMPRRGHGGRDDVAGADAGRGHQQAGADRGERRAPHAGGQRVGGSRSPAG